MEFKEILSILGTIGTFVLGGFSIYLKVSPKAQTKAKEIQETIAKITANTVIYIAEAEKEYKNWTGGAKFDKVVTDLYKLIPEGLNKIITRDMIEDIVQSTFDEIKVYLTVKMDRVADGIEIKKVEAEEVNTKDSVG